ncbi:isochorismatase family protein [Desulforhopalus vacuolatus]|uniref:isochorismatase family protein n=1 Tax=Desulforhopalus vacuolatus TaxID=40414 RepID=UPI0019668CE2|nr:isochorismatase family protein [Desulforhopalus vacuolatus]MBM9519782.1 isochorismatase family protein [Desulforhopalus vacuolatus]
MFSTTAAIIVDLQEDFTTLMNGALPVPGSDEHFIQETAECAAALKAQGCRIYGTIDWHPRDHISFYTSHPGKKAFDSIEIDGHSQKLWPPHCIQESAGAVPLVPPGLCETFITKGRNPRFDSYSGFFDDGGVATGLDDILRQNNIDTLLICGLAFDYCVKATALDAIRLGYTVIIIKELTAAVDPDSAEQAQQELTAAGVCFISAASLLF